MIFEYNFLCRGTGNYTQCQTLIRQRFNKTSCTSSSCSFDGVYEPVPILSSLKFIGISAVYSTFNTLAPNVTVSPDSNNNYNLASTNLTLIYAALQNICNQPWTDLVNPETKYRPCKIQIFILYNILWVLYSIMFLFNVSLDII
jgi:Golgi nucleoside diphosphatase